MMARYRIHDGGMWGGLPPELRHRATLEMFRYLREQLDPRFRAIIDDRMLKTHVLLAAECSGMPPDASVAVMMEGDGAFLYLEGRSTTPFPDIDPRARQHGGGASDCASAAALETLRRQGCGYLLVPRPAYWRLEAAPTFRAHLDRYHELLWTDEQVVIYRLGSVSSSATTVAKPGEAGEAPIPVHAEGT
jgi:hypothetical protein